MSETPLDVLEKLARDAAADHMRGEIAYDASQYDFRQAATPATVLSLLEELRHARGEREEALDRVEELERDAEIVSAEFEKDCWVAVRALLEKVGWTDFSEGVTASDACDIIAEAIQAAESRALKAEEERKALVEAVKLAAQLAEQIQHGNATPFGGAKLIADNSRTALSSLSEAADQRCPKCGSAVDEACAGESVSACPRHAADQPLPKTEGEEPVGAAEREVGRYAYRRIEALMDAKSGTADAAELEYLARIAESVEEYGEDACAASSLAPFPAPSLGGMAASRAPKAVATRIAAGQMFNTYEGTENYLIGIGPVSDFLCMAETPSALTADYISAALRSQAGQPPLPAPPTDSTLREASDEG